MCPGTCIDSWFVVCSRYWVPPAVPPCRTFEPETGFSHIHRHSHTQHTDAYSHTHTAHAHSCFPSNHRPLSPPSLSPCPTATWRVRLLVCTHPASPCDKHVRLCPLSPASLGSVQCDEPVRPWNMGRAWTGPCRTAFALSSALREAARQLRCVTCLSHMPGTSAPSHPPPPKHVVCAMLEGVEGVCAGTELS